MAEIEENLMPKHIAIIMDGNRRWAKQKKIDPKLGHKAGAETLENIVHYANNIGIKYITVYAFSTENWKRSKDEVNALMILLQNYFEKFRKRAELDNIKINVLGNRAVLSKKLQKCIETTEKETKDKTGIVFNIAFNYGGREELTHAVKQIAKDVKDGKISEDDINEELISNNLYTKGMPDPDLLIRTSGEIRLSNFLPWQLVYSEFVFIQKNWPDFSERDLDEAIEVYKNRNRKFGGK